MSPLLRILIAGAAVALVVAVARLASRWLKPIHPAIDLEGLGSRPGVILFTSTGCETCTAAGDVVDAADVGVRRVTWEGEPELFERYGIEAVPLVIVLGADGTTYLTETGIPDSRHLGPAIRRAGIR
jgi:hypothetical protein